MRVTSEKIGRGGKKDTLEKVVDKSCNLIHIDDNQQVLEECNQAGISVIGIIVPRRRGRAAGVSYVKHGVCSSRSTGTLAGIIAQFASHWNLNSLVSTVFLPL